MDYQSWFTQITEEVLKLPVYAMQIMCQNSLQRYQKNFVVNTFGRQLDKH